MTTEDLQFIFMCGAFAVAVIALIVALINGRAVEGLQKFGDDLNKNISLQNRLENEFKKQPLEVQQKLVDVAEGLSLVTRNTKWTWDEAFAEFLVSITDSQSNTLDTTIENTMLNRPDDFRD